MSCSPITFPRSPRDNYDICRIVWPVFLFPVDIGLSPVLTQLLLVRGFGQQKFLFRNDIDYHLAKNSVMKSEWVWIILLKYYASCTVIQICDRTIAKDEAKFNLLKPTGHVMRQQFNIQQLYVLPTLYLCVLYLSENKQRLVPPV